MIHHTATTVLADGAEAAGMAFGRILVLVGIVALIVVLVRKALRSKETKQAEQYRQQQAAQFGQQPGQQFAQGPYPPAQYPGGGPGQYPAQHQGQWHHGQPGQPGQYGQAGQYGPPPGQ